MGCITRSTAEYEQVEQNGSIADGKPRVLAGNWVIEKILDEAIHVENWRIGSCNRSTILYEREASGVSKLREHGVAFGTLGHLKENKEELSSLV